MALARSGNYEGAAAAFQRVIAVDSRSVAAHVNLGITFATAGQLENAIAAFRSAIGIAPNVAQLHFNLGAALKRRGAIDEAILAYGRAAALEPSVAALNNLGSALRERGRVDEAITAFRRALRIDERSALVHLNLGTALEDKEKLEEATAAYERACVLDPGLAPAQRALAQVLVERDLVYQGFAEFRRYARRAGDNRSRTAIATSAPARKQRHDSEQAHYLQEEGTPEAPELQIDETACLSHPVLNPANDAARIESAWISARPKIVVVDDLLTGESLDALRRFCWRSTIWNSSYGGGYLGAFPEDGFAPAVLARASAEFRTRFPAIFRRLPLKLWWAFKCESGAPGIGIHADFAAVNVNFWITPDAANLDAESGGLRIWSVPAPLEWDYQKYNADPAGIREFLARAGAKSVTVPYRANRAVIFDSNLFHETHRPRFKDGYLNRRINITLLYGLRESADDDHPAIP
ncbi:MAG TPA: tetratricopeptide repeat protein [Stellaceae bacterium]|nr:tetratricopeptide repeat protein [Stellaceae bacterium]